MILVFLYKNFNFFEKLHFFTYMSMQVMELKKQRCNCGLTSFLVHETKVVILLFNINIKGIQRLN